MNGGMECELDASFVKEDGIGVGDSHGFEVYRAGRA